MVLIELFVCSSRKIARLQRFESQRAIEERDFREERIFCWIFREILHTERGEFGETTYIRLPFGSLARYTCSTYNVSDALRIYRFDGSTRAERVIRRRRKKTSVVVDVAYPTRVCSRTSLHLFAVSARVARTHAVYSSSSSRSVIGKWEKRLNLCTYNVFLLTLNVSLRYDCLRAR